MSDPIDSAVAAEKLLWGRLAYTGYLVIPKLAIRAMPTEWQARLEALLAEADATGLETPEYVVLRDDGKGGEHTRATTNPVSGKVRLWAGREDPWSEYKYGDVKSLCPNFKGASECVD